VSGLTSKARAKPKHLVEAERIQVIEGAGRAERSG